MFILNILWDFDGTLFDTYPGYSKVFSKVLGGKVSEEEIYKRLKISLSHAIEYYNLTDSQVREMDTLKNNLNPGDFKPFDKVEEILKYVNKNVIMTHKDRDGVLAILKHYGWDKYFIDMVAIDDGFPRKPNAQAYSHLHNKYHIDLVIGDREIDILPGKELGITTCIFGTKSDIADYCLSDYAQFFEIIDRNDFNK